MRHGVAAAWAALAVLLLPGCAVTIDPGDVFALRDRHAPAAEVALEPGLERARVSELALEAESRRFLGYRYAAPAPRRAVLFFPGNGYGAPVALSRIAQVFGDAETDVYVLSYGQPGEAEPDIAQVFAMGRALAAQAAATSGVPAARVAAVGHSLGGWVALHVAGSGNVGCAVVVGSGTTAAETAAHLVPRPLAWLARFEPTPDVALLDNLALARASRVPTLVVGSEADGMMPPARARAIHAALPAGPSNQLLIASDASHGGYFRVPAVTGPIVTFLRERCGG